MRLSTLCGIGLAASLAGGCGSRSPYWDTSVDTSPSNFYPLAGGVALVDPAANRVVLLTGAADEQLSTPALPIGHNYASAATSPDGSALFVLSNGDWPRRSESDELPSLSIISLASDLHAAETRYTMSQALGNLAIDPLGKYVVAYQGARSSTSFAQNPNEIVIFDRTRPPDTHGSPGSAPNPVSRTLRSFGGTPQRVAFGPPMNLPANAASAGATATSRRLLVLETELDVTFLDLDHAFDVPTPRPEITVRLTSGADAQSVTPAGLAIDDNPDDGRFALRTQNDRNIYTLQMVPAVAGAPNDFNPTINVTDVGGTPSDVAFVRTDQGLRVAALVPSTSSAVLVEPDTGVTTQVVLPGAFSSLSLVTNVVNASSPTDVALLWSAGSGVASGVALWTLGVTVGRPYRSIEVLPIASPIEAVHDIPTPYDRLKVLETTGGGDFFVLDLLARTAAPIHTASAATMVVAPDGNRMWVFANGGTDLASIDFATLNPVLLTTSRPIEAVFDVARPGGDRSLIALHGGGALGATVFDALNPDTALSRQIPAILVEGP
jgi:hypothetical protein